MRHLALFLASILAASIAWGQTKDTSKTAQVSSQSMPGMDTSGSQGSMSHGNRMDSVENNDAAPMMHSMERRMDMGPHMKMTALREPTPGDSERAEKVVETARRVSERYLDYHVALAEGFKIFLPTVPQKIYHFTNYGYAAEAQVEFNPEHPTSLLYEKHGHNYKLIGVMYTAPKRFSEDDLDQRIPLSIAQWHEHTNFCAPPKDRRGELFQPHPQFGLRGSINTQQACDSAGGTFRPVIFNWMVHVYPFEKDEARIWSTERQHAD
jgi:hypothetical protein